VFCYQVEYTFISFLIPPASLFKFTGPSYNEGTQRSELPVSKSTVKIEVEAPFDLHPKKNDSSKEGEMSLQQLDALLPCDASSPMSHVAVVSFLSLVVLWTRIDFSVSNNASVFADDAPFQSRRHLQIAYGSDGS
jgi:hypothetical protein